MWCRIHENSSFSFEVIIICEKEENYLCAPIFQFSTPDSPTVFGAHGHVSQEGGFGPWGFYHILVEFSRKMASLYMNRVTLILRVPGPSSCGQHGIPRPRSPPSLQEDWLTLGTCSCVTVRSGVKLRPGTNCMLECKPLT